MSNRASSRASGPVPLLVDAVGPWADGPGPLFRRLARAIASAVERGALASGTRLPSERSAAAALAIGRGTAVAAYEVLVAEGIVERRLGSGTYVVGPDELHLPQGREGSALVHRLVDRSEQGADVVDLSLSVLRDASGLPPLAVGTDDLLDVVPDTGYTPWGLPSLRVAVARHITEWGLPTDEQQVVITTGAQQAIAAAAACWLRPGDTVVVDDPTYPGALAAFRQSAARLVAVPVDRDGVRVDALERALRERPALVYLQSSPHSPTGSVLAASRRARIAEAVTAARVPLVEDAALNDLAWRAMPPPIAACAPDASIAVVGSLSKLFWGGLRLGFVRAPHPLALRFARVKATHDLGSSAVGQVLGQRLLDAAPAAQFARRRTAELQERYDVLADALRRLLPSWSWPEPAGGLSIWVTAPAPSEAFAQHALRHGVAVASSGALSAVSPAAVAVAGGGEHANRFRLSFAAPPAELEEGARRLAAAWRARR